MTLTAETVRALVELGAEVDHTVIEDTGQTVIFAREGLRPHTFQPLNPRLPDFILQGVELSDAQSFCRYVNQFETSETEIFARSPILDENGSLIEPPRLVAVLDYHSSDGKPGRKNHVATYPMRMSDEWRNWQEACSGTMEQAEFAEFVEENRRDIIEPSAAGLLDIVRTFKANKKVAFSSTVQRPDGGVQLVYGEDVEQTGASGVLPETMQIGIPIFFRGTGYTVDVFVRFRVVPGKVLFDLKLDRADVVLDQAFKELLGYVENGFGTDGDGDLLPGVERERVIEATGFRPFLGFLK